LALLIGFIFSGTLTTTVWHKFVYPRLVSKLGWLPTKIIERVGKKKLSKFLKKSGDKTKELGYNTNVAPIVAPHAPKFDFGKMKDEIEQRVNEQLKAGLDRIVGNSNVPVNLTVPVALPVKPVEPVNIENNVNVNVSSGADQYVKELFAQSDDTYSGYSPQHWAIRSGLYKKAVSLLKDNILFYDKDVPLQGQDKTAEAIEEWVSEQYFRNIQITDFSDTTMSFHSQAYLGILYWQAVQMLSRGEFKVLGHVATAEAIEKWVQSEFMKKYGV